MSVLSCTHHAAPLPSLSRSGKTTLLRALAGQLRERADLQVGAGFSTAEARALQVGIDCCSYVVCFTVGRSQRAACLASLRLACMRAGGSLAGRVCVCCAVDGNRFIAAGWRRAQPPTLPSCPLQCPPAQVTGKVLYNGRSFDEFIPERSAAYISQVRSAALCCAVRCGAAQLPRAACAVPASRGGTVGGAQDGGPAACLAAGPAGPAGS